MSIHITRGNMLAGSGAPQVSAEYYGQTYIDTATSPRQPYIAGAENNVGWIPLAHKTHTHKVSDISDLRTAITELIQNEGIEAALTAMRGENNTWDGDWNVFNGVIRSQGFDVITKGSSIGDLKDVEIGENLAVNTVLGWNGSTFVPYAVTGASPSEGGLDFTKYIQKADLVTDYTVSATDKALAVGGAKALFEAVKAGFAPIDHTHTDLATKDHIHSNYLDKTIAQTITKNLSIDVGDNSNPLNLANKYGKINFILPGKTVGTGGQGGQTNVEFSGGNGIDLDKVVMSGTDGAMLDTLILNFNKIKIPTGGLEIGENKKSLEMPALKITTNGTPYIGSLDRMPALDLNNGSAIGAKQLVFRSPAGTRLDGIFFPKDYAGNGQPTDIGYYHFLRLFGGELITDTALASEKRYISLNGKRIFFSTTDPGREAREGDLWFKC